MAPVKQRGHGALIRIASCFPSFSLVPFYHPAQPDSADAGGWGTLRGSAEPRGCHCVGRVPRVRQDRVGPTRLRKAANREYSPAPCLLLSPASPPQKAALLPSNSFCSM